MPVGQLGRRQAVLFSLIVHLMIVSFLTNRTKIEPPKPKPQVATHRPPLVFVPPKARVAPPPLAPAVPREARPTPPPPLPEDRSLRFHRPDAFPTPEPTPPPRDRPTDRISIGTANGPVQHEFSPGLKAPGAPAAQPSPATETRGPDAAAADERAGARKVTPRGRGDQPVLPGEHSIMGSVRRLEQQMADLGPTGEGGTVKQMGPLLFDPQGADFTAWVNHWQTEVYRNWIPPQAAFFGFGGGEVGFEFTVERDGSLSSVRMLTSTGSRPLDRAAENALRGARMLPLPSDYSPARLSIKVTFIYGPPKAKGPQGS